MWTFVLEAELPRIGKKVTIWVLNWHSVHMSSMGAESYISYLWNGLSLMKNALCRLNLQLERTHKNYVKICDMIPHHIV